MAILTCFLVILIPYANSITFNITNINPNSQNMFSLEGGAYISDDGIQVTPETNLSASNRFTTGRATYIKPLHLWDNTSSELASFSTSFSFVIAGDPNNRYHPDDGFTFFFAGDSLIHGLGPMGLPLNNTSNNVTVPFVAVEFDTYCSDWDNASKCDHVGISINSLASVMHQEWFNDVSNGRECEAWIEYDLASKNFSVSFTGFQNNTVVHQDGLVYTVDLRNELPEWVIFGFSAAASVSDEKNNVKSWMFNSSSLQVDDSDGLPSNKTGLVVGLIIGPLVLFSILVIVALVLQRKKKKNAKQVEEVRSYVEMNNDFELGATGPSRFSYLEIVRSTTGFAEKQKLGEGGFGGVYKGYLKDLSKYVAVKRFSKTSKQGIKQYASEVRIISQLRHKNLVQLIGWCHEQGELLLVYDFMENGSLDLHLFKGKSLLTWDTRYKIARGLASALLYLHEEWKQCVLHRDIKSSNVMLDSSFNAKLGDFGLAKLVDHEKSSQTTILAGTLGYMAPECVVTGKASKESDVFSFGVVALEIACARKSIEYNTQGQIWLPEWVWKHYGTSTLLEAVDPQLGLDFEEEEITRLMIVGLWCVHPDSEFRPSMRQVIQVLSSQASLPTLPSQMPVASYSTPPISSIIDIQSSSTSRQTISSIASYLHGR